MDAPVVLRSDAYRPQFQRFTNVFANSARVRLKNGRAQSARESVQHQLELVEQFKQKSRLIAEKTARLEQITATTASASRTAPHRVIWANEWQHLNQLQDTLEKEMLRAAGSSGASLVHDALDLFHATNQAVAHARTSLSTGSIQDISRAFRHLQPLRNVDEAPQCTLALETVVSNHDAYDAARERVETAWRLFDAAAADESLDNLDQLEKHHACRQQALVAAFSEILKFNDLEDPASVQLPTGWTTEKHEWLSKLYSEYERADRAGLLPGMMRMMQALEERARLETPKLPAGEIRRHFRWKAALASFQAQRQALAAAELADVDRFVSETERDSKAAADAAIKHEQRVQEMEAQLEHATKAAATLREWRAQKAEKLVQLENAQRDAQDQATAADAAWQARRRQLHDEVANFRAQLAEKARQESERTALAEQLSATLRQAQNQRNAARIAFRDQLRHARAARQGELREQLEQDRVKTEAVLEKLRATVRPVVSVSTERLRSDIKATRIARELHSQSDSAATQAALSSFTVRHGYTGAQILGDRRVRLGIALASANLQHTDYARAVQLQVAASCPYPAHLRSQVRF